MSVWTGDTSLGSLHVQKSCFPQYSLFFSIADSVIPTTEVAGPGPHSWPCTWPPGLLPAPGVGGIKHLLPLWVITPEAHPTFDRPHVPCSCELAKSGKRQKQECLFGKLKGTGDFHRPTFILWWIPPNSGKGFRCWATQMVTSVYHKHDKMLSTQNGTQTPATCHGMWAAWEGGELDEHYGESNFLFHICTRDSCPKNPTIFHKANQALSSPFSAKNAETKLLQVVWNNRRDGSHSQHSLKELSVMAEMVFYLPAV